MRHHPKSIAVLLSCLGLMAIGSPSAHAAEPASGPTLQKDSLQVTAYTVNEFQGDYAVWSWVPHVQFRLNGPIASGDQVYVDFKLPSGAPWAKIDCPTEAVEPAHWKKFEGGGKASRDAGMKGILETGTVAFSVRVRNELASTDVELFSGKVNVANVHSNETAPNCAKHMVYYTDQNWTLPIGYAYLVKHSTKVAKAPSTLAVAFWARGAESNEFGEPHLFYQGKEVGLITMEGMHMSKASTEADVTDGPTSLVDPAFPQGATWSRIVCSFPSVYAVENRDPPPAALPHQQGTAHQLKPNPGEYEVKVLRKNHLARSIKFTVTADGKIDDALTKANAMGDDRAIVPVQIIGDQDGTWNHDAWKTDAFYGHPPTGFTPVP